MTSDKQHPLATVTGIGTVIGLLLRDGAMCPKCGHGTRATSKRWARCKKCGERVQRMQNVGGQMPPVSRHFCGQKLRTLTPWPDGYYIGIGRTHYCERCQSYVTLPNAALRRGEPDAEKGQA